jgi:hypothetical protein
MASGIKSETKIIPGTIVGLSFDEMIIYTLGLPPDKGSFVVDGRIILGIVQTNANSLVKASLLSKDDITMTVRIMRNFLENGSYLVSNGIANSENGKMIIKEIPASDKIQKDDQVIAVSKTGDLFLVGVIDEIKLAQNNVNQEATVKLAAIPDKSLTVGIIE